MPKLSKEDNFLAFILKPLNLISQIIKQEIDHYNKLSAEGRHLLLSIFLFTLANPMLSVFINSFLWRKFQSVGLVTLYNCATFVGIPLGFLINGFLLKKYLPKKLYFIGVITQGIIVSTLLYLPHITPLLLTLIGVGMGIMAGIYWSNRSLLVMNVTKNHQRVYFVGLENILATLTNIIVPFFIGWFIVFGNSFISTWSTTAYKLLALMLLGLLFISGRIIQKMNIEIPKMKEVTPITPSKRWQRFRIMTLIFGSMNGIELVLPPLMVLILMGNEKSLGTIMAISGVFVSIALYQIARRVGKNYRFRTLCLAILLSLSASFLFGTFYSVFGVICYFVLNSFAQTMRFTIIGPLSLEVIGKEENRQAQHRYLFILDREVFNNIGRNASLSLFFIIYLISPNFALRFSPLFFALPLLVGLYLMNTIEKELVLEEIIEKTPVFSYVKAFYNRKFS